MTKLNVRADIGGYLFAAIIAVCAYAILMTFHLRNIDVITSAAYGVIEGKPHWLTYQNRLLGPYLVLFISKIGLSYATAWQVFTGLFLLIESLLLFHLLRRDNLSASEAIKYLIIFMICFLVLQNYWFYTWDSIDLVIFTLFAYGVVNSKSAFFFFLLFLIGILNRESALFIALFVVIDAFKFNTASFLVKFVDVKKFLLGCVLLASGIFYTNYVRHALFVSKSDGQPDAEHVFIIGNHIFLNSISYLHFDYIFSIGLLYFLSALVAIILFAAKVRKRGDREFKCFLMLLILIANIFMFGAFNETRVFFIILPFVLFLWIRVTMDNRVSKTH